MAQNVVTCVTWLPSGCMNPKRDPSPEDLVDSDQESDTEAMDIPVEQPQKGLRGLDMHKYDAEVATGEQLFTAAERVCTKKDKHLEYEEDSDDEYLAVRDTDHVLVAAVAEEDQTSLEVYVYEDESCNLFVHHTILLGAYPLATEWLSTVKNRTGNFLAVGSFAPEIEIWDLDLCDVAMPKATLGKERKDQKKIGHTDAVLCLSSNQKQKHVLASGSADNTVMLWDVHQEKVLETFSHHADKVQCTAWHPAEHAVLLTASYDRTVSILDVRQAGGAVATTKLSADAECAVWSVQNPMQCFASSEDGNVQCLDVRSMAESKLNCVWNLEAHDGTCTSVSDGAVKNLLITAGLDGNAKVWDTSSETPKLSYSRKLRAGPLFHCSINSKEASVAAFGGDQVVIWDLRDTECLVNNFNL